MRPTRLARTLMALAGALFISAFLSLSVVPAACALVLLVWLLHARISSADAFRRAALRLSRRVVEPILHQGMTFHVELDATRSAVPAEVRILVEDLPPPELQALDPPRGEGPVLVRYAARALAKGSRRYAAARVTLRDGRGLWQSTRVVPVETSVQVLASLDEIRAGRVLARRKPLEARARSAVGLLLRDLEFDTLREFSPGDRMRDVDWKRVALHQRLLTKTWEREMEATVALLVDAGRTMRASRGGVSSRLEHAATLAMEVAQAAAERSHRLSYLAFDEVSVVDELPPSRDPATVRLLSRRLAELPSRILARRRLDVGAPGDAPLDDAETDFLAALASLRGAAPAASAARARPGLGAAMSRLLAQAGDERLLVVVFTDLERLPDSSLQALGRVASDGHRVVTVVLPGAKFAPPGAEPPRVRDLENAYREEMTRRKARSALLARGVRMLEMGPGSNAAPIVEAGGAKPEPRGARG